MNSPVTIVLHEEQELPKAVPGPGNQTIPEGSILLHEPDRISYTYINGEWVKDAEGVIHEL